MTTRAFALAAGLAAALSLAACAAGQDRPSAAPVVARWGDVALRADDFAQEYRRFASTAAVRDGLAARRDYARLMVARRVIAERGRAAGLDRLPEVQAHVRRQRARALRRHFLETAVGDTIPEAAEAAVREAFRRSQTRLHLQQIYAATEAEADSLHRLLQAGADFDALAEASMRRYGVPNPEAAGDMGWVTWNDLDRAPEDAVFALERGAVSAPVASLQGWHLFRLLGREETRRLDASAYAAERERLAFLVRQRRFDEASARYLRALRDAHALVVHAPTLRAVWAEVAPLVPDRPTPDDVARLNAEVGALAPPEVPRSRPAAWVDGRPFTVGQLLDGLPDVPLASWQPVLRTALETTIRDSLLTAEALAARADTARSVAQAARMARADALYYAALRAAADTLTLDHRVPAMYEQVKDEQFVAVRTTTYDAYRFADSTAAWDALRRYQRDGDWPAAADAYGAARERRTAEGAADLPVHTAPLPGADGRPRPVGPYPEDGAFVVVAALDRHATYEPLAAVRSRVETLLRSRLRAVVHDALLPDGFTPDAVTVYDDRLQAAL